MMDQLKEQSKKAGEKLEGLAKKTQQELEKTSKKAQESIEKATKQTKDSLHKATKQGKGAMETTSSGIKSATDAFHLEIGNSTKKAKRHRKDSSDSDSDEEEGLLDDIGGASDHLTLSQRALGAIGCYILSGLFAFTASLILCSGVHHVRFYALFYSLSNVATFCSLVFIMGQDRLQKRMLSRKRSSSGRAWMGSLALTVLVAFFWPSHWFLVLLLLLVQFGSMIWYSLSFIPFGRKFMHKYMAKRIILVDAMDGKLDGK
ncbi:hypothetical protein PsorP6_016133 [Peronosclerospora sorghi]|uniref:Uncharacterized protein n=1 Tax=Peronosclerospora sorghi TaxID=230839 RepID=A0ACC0VNP9_9STRA|nr:hypothetical protein PsorP6_016133 [Peronosclerospora sorghi]